MDDPVLEEEPKCAGIAVRVDGHATFPQADFLGQLEGQRRFVQPRRTRPENFVRTQEQIRASGRFQAPLGGRGRQWPRLEPPAERPFQPLHDRPRSRRAAQRQAPGKQSERELRSAFDAQASRLCFRVFQQGPAPCDSASTWPIASVMPRSTSQRNMAVQRSVCRVEEIATDPRPIPSTAVTRQFTRRGRAWSPTSTISRDESTRHRARPERAQRPDHPMARPPRWKP